MNKLSKKIQRGDWMLKFIAVGITTLLLVVSYTIINAIILFLNTTVGIVGLLVLSPFIAIGLVALLILKYPDKKDYQDYSAFTRRYL